MANTNTGNQQKKVYTPNDLVNLGQQAYDAVDEQAILNKYNQATAAQFVAQQDQNRVAENNFYNQMYNTQKTAMDTIRQSNANAVSTGASRGVQAANELSALLGLQQESIASATEIANARRQTAQEETAAMLQNIVQASQDAAAQRQQALQSMIQARSLKATEDANVSAAADRELTAVTEGGEALRTYYAQEGHLGADGDWAQSYNAEGVNFINIRSKDGIDTSLQWKDFEEQANSQSTVRMQTKSKAFGNRVAEVASDLNITDTDYNLWKTAVLTKNPDAQLPSTLSEFITSAQDKYYSAGVNSSNWQHGIQDSGNVYNTTWTAISDMYTFKSGGPQTVTNTNFNSIARSRWGTK